MKELEGALKITPDTELIAEIQKEYTLKAKMQVQRGLHLFAVKYPEMTAELVKITSTPIIQMDKSVKVEHRAMHDPEAFYMWATNKENAIRKVVRDITNFIKLQEYKKSIVLEKGSTVSVNGQVIGTITEEVK